MLVSTISRCSAVAIFVLAALGAAPSLVAAQPVKPDLVTTKYGERRAYFRDWLAACRPDGYCSVLAYNGAGPGAAGVDADYILRVASPASDAPLRVEFTGVAEYVDTASSITLVIDGGMRAVLEPGAADGWRRHEQAINEYLFSADAAEGALVPSMQRGARIRVQFMDQNGSARDVAFSLMGLTGALSWIEGARMR